MLETLTALPNVEWPYLPMLLRLTLALALGLLIGLERERRGKEAGLRTFGFISLMGALGGSLGPAYALLILFLVGVLAVILNVHTLRLDRGTELTTSAAMLVTCLAGVLCGQGHTATPAAVMVIATALLAWKERLAGFSAGLTEGELRSALLLAILAIVIYPALPMGAIDPWELIEPRAAWVTVILIAAIGFVNYILWKLYGPRGTELSGFFGGLVNSNFTVIELSSRVRQAPPSFIETAYRGILLATTAMITRNATLLLLLAPLALMSSLAAFGMMLLTSIALVAWSYRASRRDPVDSADPIRLETPFSLVQALKYGMIFLGLHIVGGLTQREFGDLGFYFVSVIGGLLSSASAVAAAASLEAQGAVTAEAAGVAALLASFTSLAFSLSFVLRTRNTALVRRLGIATVCIAIAGVSGLLVWVWIYPRVAHLVPTLPRWRR